MLNTISNLISDTTDSIILAAITGAAAVSVYTIGHNFQNYFSQLSTAVSSVFAPKVNMLVAKENDNKTLTELMTRIGRIQFYITSLIIIGFITVGKQFIMIWAGEGYEDSYIIAILLLFACYIPFSKILELKSKRLRTSTRQEQSYILLLL